MSHALFSHVSNMYLYVSGDIWCISMFLMVFVGLTQTSLLALAEGPGREGFTKELEDKFHRWSPDRTQTQDRRHPKTSEDWIKTMTFHDLPWLQKNEKVRFAKSVFVSCFLKHLDSERQLSKFHSIPVKVPREHHLQEAGHSPGPPGMAQWGRVEGCAQVVLRLCLQPVHTKKPSVLPVFRVFRVWQCDTKALVISVLTTVDMLYAANDLSRAQPCQVAYRTRSGTW